MESISKKELVRDMQWFRCDIATLQRQADFFARRIDGLPDDPPKHEWKVGEWFFDKDRNAIYQIHEVTMHGRLESRAVDSCGGTEIRWHDPEHCIPVHFIQTPKSTIGEGSIVRTPDGWVGSVLDRRGADEWFVFRYGSESDRGWYSVSELTLCPPEGK